MGDGAGPPQAGPRADLVDEDPRDILTRVLAASQERAVANSADLAEARHALARLQAPEHAPDDVARVTLEVAPSLISNLIATTTGPILNLIMATDVGAAADDPAMDAFTREVTAGGRPLRGLYDASVLERPESLAHAQAYRQAGEEQRLLDDVPTEFGVFGTEAVVCTETWGDPVSDYVLIRDPMLVTAFTVLFEVLWDDGHPFPSARSGPTEDDDEQLLDLLVRGFKDEAIARYLGWSLRTVRRRVARLMEDLGARTRFQLGAQAVRSGRLGDPGQRAGALPGARLGRSPRSR